MGNVYFAKCGGLVKIGYAQDIAERLVQLQTGNPRGIQIVAVVRNVLPSVEKHYHRAFAEYRERGEWFRHEGALSAVIRHIQGGAQPTTPAAIEYYKPLPRPAKQPDPRQGEIGKIHRELRTRLKGGEAWSTVRAEFMAKGPDHVQAVESFTRRYMSTCKKKKAVVQGALLN